MYEISERPRVLAPHSTTGRPSRRPRRCGVCAGVEQVGTTYFERAFDEHASVEAAGEAIADGLGFCEAHSRALSFEAGRATRVARAFSAAITRIEPLLHQSVVDERCQRLFFSGRHRCPACTANDATAAKLLTPVRQDWLGSHPSVGRTELLCWHHFQSMAGRLLLEPRGQAIQRYLDVVDSASQALQQRANAGMVRASALLGQDLRRAWAEASGPSTPPPRMRTLLAMPDRCPICEIVADAKRNWLRDLRSSFTRYSAEYLWLFAPCCHRHVSDVVHLGDRALLEAVAAFVLSGIHSRLKQQLADIVRDLALAREPKPVWYRSRRRNRDTAAPSVPAPVRALAPRCRACEAEAIALERATAHFVSEMHDEQGRDLLGMGHGLCLSHLAHVLPVAPSATVRAFLSDLHSARLRDLHANLALRAGGPSAPWREAIYRFRGWTR